MNIKYKGNEYTVVLTAQTLNGGDYYVTYGDDNKVYEDEDGGVRLCEPLCLIHADSDEVTILD